MGVALMTMVGGGGIHLIAGFSSLEELMQTQTVVVELCGSGVCFEVGSE